MKNQAGYSKTNIQVAIIVIASTLIGGAISAASKTTVEKPQEVKLEQRYFQDRKTGKCYTRLDRNVDGKITQSSTTNEISCNPDVVSKLKLQPKNWAPTN